MIVKLGTNKLKIGMFIDLSEYWVENPFWKNQFEISTEKDIQKIIKAGIKSVNVNTIKSKVKVEATQNNQRIVINKETIKNAKEVANNLTQIGKEHKSKINKLKKEANTNRLKVISINTQKDNVVDKPSKSIEWNPEKFMSASLIDTFRDKSLPPNDRAKAVEAYSMEIMKNVLESPSAEVITSTKKGISEIVEVILHENDTANALTKIVSHDYYTYTHSVNVGIKAILLAKRLYRNSDKHDMNELGAGFFLHDLGKVNVNSDIINKPGRLTEDEMNEMKTHPYQGYKILSATKQLTEEAWIIVMQHHERNDGKGYPRKLSGEEIHPYAHICCIADVYDALTAKRSYKEAMEPIKALKIMYEEMANNFNKELLQKFVSLFKEKK